MNAPLTIKQVKEQIKALAKENNIKSLSVQYRCCSVREPYIICSYIAHQPFVTEQDEAFLTQVANIESPVKIRMRIYNHNNKKINEYA
jgi:hypothetical protein